MGESAADAIVLSTKVIDYIAKPPNTIPAVVKIHLSVKIKPNIIRFTTMYV